jgi:hypothetical protein
MHMQEQLYIIWVCARVCAMITVMCAMFVILDNLHEQHAQETCGDRSIADLHIL